MVLSLIFGILILVIVIFVAMRIFSNIILGGILIGLILLASYLILGSLPTLNSIPLIGKYIPKLTIGGEAVLLAKNKIFSMEVVEVSRDVENNLLITVANTGKMPLSNLKVFVDEQASNIINKPKDPLNPKEFTTIQVDWNKSFEKILIKSDQKSILFYQ